MAKLESTAVKKPKGKKRKHGSIETEDEVANKSVIVEANVEEDEPMQTNVECEQLVTTKKYKKRKNKIQGEIEEKRSKLQQNGQDTKLADEDHEVGNDFHKPTLEELKESAKTENKLAIISGRIKKKQKHQKLVDAQKSQTIEKEKQRNADYLNKWKYERDSWKFEKLRQISIQHTMFEDNKLDANTWPIALQYLAASKGSAKDTILKLANDAIEEVDKLGEQQETDQDRRTILSSTKYQRARELLQLFD